MQASVDNEWAHFLHASSNAPPHVGPAATKWKSSFVPQFMPLNIATITVELVMSRCIRESEFWDIPVIPYHFHKEGVVKKQIRVKSVTPEDDAIVTARVAGLDTKGILLDNHVITLHTPTPHTPERFLCIRRIVMGTCKKDLMKRSVKPKNAFCNCFTVICRIFDDEETHTFREFHIKVFMGTPKIEIPGVRNTQLLNKLVRVFTSVLAEDITILRKSNILVNSNFACNFMIHKQRLEQLLSSDAYPQVHVMSTCTYPGVKCIYHRPDETNITFMVFRTGRVIITGKCEEPVVHDVYAFVVDVLRTHCDEILVQEKPDWNDTYVARNGIPTVVMIYRPL